MDSRPALRFFYSNIYDQVFTQLLDKPYDAWAQWREVTDYIAKLRARWGEVADEVFAAFEQIMSVRWGEPKEITCYVVSHCPVGAFSHPLTLRLQPDLDLAIDTLIHELVHVISLWPDTKLRQRWRTAVTTMHERFLDAAWASQLHAVVYPLHKAISRRVLGEAFVAQHFPRHRQLAPRTFELLDSLGPEFEAQMLSTIGSRDGSIASGS